MSLHSKALHACLLAAMLVSGSSCQQSTTPAIKPAATTVTSSPANAASVSAPSKESTSLKTTETANTEPANLVSDPPSASSEPPVDDELAAKPLDLTTYYSMKSSVFDKIVQYPWPAVPRGSQTFANVPLEIGGAIFLWGERNANNGQKYREEISGIPIQAKFETLYICHGAFFEAKAGTPMCEIQFHYDDGTTANDAIVCGDDTRDWFANREEKNLGPAGPRSTLAWDGDGKQGDRTQAIRFCLTAIANPHPDKFITTIDLVSSKTQTAACILAITPGPAGLMKKADVQATSEE